MFCWFIKVLLFVHIVLLLIFVLEGESSYYRSSRRSVVGKRNTTTPPSWPPTKPWTTDPWSSTHTWWPQTDTTPSWRKMTIPRSGRFRKNNIRKVATLKRYTDMSVTLTPPENHICYDTKILHFTTTVLTKEPCEKDGFPSQVNMSYVVPAKPVDFEDSHGRGEDDIPVRWCYVHKKLNVTVHVKYRKCCNGWTLGADGKCNIRLKGACQIGCINGGTCDVMTNHTCICTESFTGDTCEIPLCDIPCHNGGMCTIDGTCDCPASFSGKFCEIPRCENSCQNGASCVANGLQASCLCPSGFHGKTCEKRVVEPSTKPTCPYRGHNYTVGSTFHVLPCKLCTCLNPRPHHPHGGATCSNVPCPECPGNKTRHDRTTCCPLCVSPEKKPDNYKLPIIKNCPDSKDVMILNLKHSEHAVKIPTTIEAIDFMGHPVPVKMSSKTFAYKRTKSLQSNLHTVVVSAVDDWEGQRLCQFIVRVKDPIEPRFTFCPSDMLDNVNQTANYPQPRATDNIGLVTNPPQCDISRDKKRSVVTCVATDFEGNEAYCQFTIHHFQSELSRKNAEDKVYPHRAGQPYPPSYPHPHKDHLDKTAIIGGVIGACIVLLFALVAMFVFRKRRHRRSPDDNQAGRNQAVTIPVQYVNNPTSVSAAPPRRSSVTLRIGDENFELPPAYERIISLPRDQWYENQSTDGKPTEEKIDLSKE